MRACSNWENLINNSYRTLLNNGRNYAAFDQEQLKRYLGILKCDGAARILDPMSGYGTLTPHANRLGIATYCVEINTPCYLWQLLTEPRNAKNYLMILERALQTIELLPEEPILWETSRNGWIAPTGKILLRGMYSLLFDEAIKLQQSQHQAEVNAISILLPFSSRLATVQNGDVQHIKRGSTAVYRHYREDFFLYLQLLQQKLFSLTMQMLPTYNEIQLGDSKSFDFGEERFNFMLTSPPYPNLVDYAKMFGAENALIDFLNGEGLLHLPKNLDDPIGSNVVSGKESGEIWSTSANRFIDKIISFRKTAKAADDNRVYYGPYFRNYFYNIQVAYQHISKYLAAKFTGIVVVRNNTARNYVVPAAEAIIETWRELGFNAEIEEEREMFHVGSKNPHAKGFKAKHMEYVIKVWRDAP